MEKNGNKKNSDAKIKANNKYRNSHYKRLCIDIKPADFMLIYDYARTHNISKAALIIRAVKWCISHNIDLTEAEPKDSGKASED